MQISSITFQDALFPDRLREISSPPRHLFTLGNITNMDTCVAVVGSRKPTVYGQKVAHQLAGELASAGVVIVSGLAYGIDGLAHEAAIEAGGRTVAVMAGGLGSIYPAQHRELAKSILAHNGALISEHPTGTAPLKQHFASRNRIISGLSLAVIVPEADATSGSLITANFALEQGRLVMAVPGQITSPRSAGPNNLLRAGAIPITSSSDVIATLGLDQLQSRPMATAVSADEALLLQLMSAGHNSSETLIARSGMFPAQFAGTISLMEITGKVRNLGAGQWIGR
jgi:DNA processing protein